jgi:hypothetical protein
MRLTRLAIWAAMPVAMALGQAAPRLALAGPTSVEAPVAAPSSATAPGLFDPARHMRISEVRAGMKGYGLSVFRGTKLERFEVEVLSVLRNFNPKCDVVLITCHGANLEHTGSIAGMSGSPIYLKDDSGRFRMIGAFAYGWPLAKDPIAGVQPIEYMLKLPTNDPEHPVAGRPASSEGSAPTGTATPRSGESVEESAGVRWSLDDAKRKWATLMHPPAALDQRSGRDGAGRLTGEGDIPRLEPLATPLMAGGLSQRLLDELGPAFRAAGLTTLQAGGGGGAPDDAPGENPPALEPGSVLAVPLLTGDVDMTAIGTCTEVLGDRVYAFGHAFNNEGPVTLPLGAGQVNGVVATLSTSFKLGSMTRLLGRLTNDQTVGVSGRIGDLAPTIPVDFKVIELDGRGGATEREYHFRSASHPKFTPLITNAAFSAAVGGASELPQYNTVDYTVDLEFGNGRAVHIADRAVNTNAADIFQDVGLAMVAAGENPFERVPLKKMSGTIKIAPEARQGQILEVNVPRSKYKPGETIKGFVTYKPFRASEDTLPVELELPKNLPQGVYQLVISDADRFLQDEIATKPFKFTAERVADIFDALKDMTAIRHDALYLRLIRHPDGVAVGRTALALLPGSRRQILMGAGRSDTTQFVSSTTKVIPTARVIAGSAEFIITIETKNHAEPGPARGPTSRPAQPGKAEEVKAKGKSMEAPEVPAPKNGN